VRADPWQPRAAAAASPVPSGARPQPPDTCIRHVRHPQLYRCHVVARCRKRKHPRVAPGELRRPATVTRMSSLAHEMASHRRRALRLLPEHYVPDAALFAHKAFRSERGCRTVGTNTLYTAACLIGLAADGSPDARDFLAEIADRSTAVLVGVSMTSEDPALLGATAWALALLEDQRACDLVERIRRLNPRRATAMGAGLALAGLSHASVRLPHLRGAARSAARQWAATLEARFVSRARLFATAEPGELRADPAHRFVTSFASQVYPVVGMAEHVLATSTAPPDSIFHAANTLSQAQGPLGQWWWMYSTRTGHVLEGYPVYVVHQDAMAVMALAALARLGDQSNLGALESGLRWLNGDNELERLLVFDDPPWFHRAIQRRRSDADGYGGMSRANHARVVLSSVVGSAPRATAERGRGFEVLTEDRPYHLGWVLLAAHLVDAMQSQGPKAGRPPHAGSAE